MPILEGCPVYKDFTHKVKFYEIFLYCIVWLLVQVHGSVKEQTTWITRKLVNVTYLIYKKKFSVTQDNMIAAFKSFTHGMFTILCLNFKKMNPLLTASEYDVL